RVTRRLDASRPIVDNDGWEHTDITDVCAIHDYTASGDKLQARYEEAITGGKLPPTVWINEKPLFARGSKYRGQPIVLSEVGGFLTAPPQQSVQDRDMLCQFHGSVETSAELLEKYRALMLGIASLKFLAGFCYTQLTDIEQELNGLLSFERIPKVSAELIAEI